MRIVILSTTVTMLECPISRLSLTTNKTKITLGFNRAGIQIFVAPSEGS
jgi:hypothetical protein